MLMKIYVVDDNSDYRRSTAWWLQGLGYKVKDFSCAQSFLDWAVDNISGDNECLLLDVRMPEMSGLDLHDRLNASGRRLPVIYMSGHASVPIAVEVMKKGAISYLEKPLNEKALEQALDLAFVQTQNKQIQHLMEPIPPVEQLSSAKMIYQNRLMTLTPREREVLEGVVDGKMNKVLAADLGISIKTIEIHRAQIKKKMKVKNTVELIKMVVKGELNE